MLLVELNTVFIAHWFSREAEYFVSWDFTSVLSSSVGVASLASYDQQKQFLLFERDMSEKKIIKVFSQEVVKDLCHFR